MEFGIRDIMYTSIEILDDLMYYRKYLRIYKKIGNQQSVQDEQEIC